MPAEKPLVVFDGKCGFCRRWIERWKRASAGRVEYAPSQEIGRRLPQVPAAKFDETVILVDGDGIHEGAQAVFRLLRHNGRPLLLTLYRSLPPFAWSAEAAYRFIARRRVLFSRLTTLLWGADVLPPSYRLGSWLMLRLIALSFLIAFLSFWSQAEGLVGKDGILPAQQYLDAVRQHLGPRAYRLVPTVLWLDAGPGAVNAAALAGAFLAALAAAGFAPAFAFAGCWALYLSLVGVGRDFMAFQWDNLLLEAGLLAVFLSPPLRHSPSLAPAPKVLWLARWLLFRLMLQSGLVKLLSGDPSWRSLAALDFHYQTQPLATWIGWYWHQLPAWFDRLSVAVMFAIELAVPFLIFFPRRGKLFAAASLIFLQAVIAATGNYGFFNLLTAALCLSLIDDEGFGRVRPQRWRMPAHEDMSRPAAARAAHALLLALVLAISVPQFLGMRRGLASTGPLAALQEAAAPFRSVNNYGLFAVMTTSRPEIEIEGSADGRTWKPYEFKWKPGRLEERPRFVAPHQPRLDWQMWFAALSDCRGNPWFAGLLVRLLQGSPAVLALFEEDPFPGAPPRYIRTLVYDYKFTSIREKSETGRWWTRELKGAYCPVASFER